MTARLFAALVVMLQSASAPPGINTRWKCDARPIEPCVTRHGRLSSQNGIALKLWLIGTKRVVAVENDVDGLPPFVQKYLEMTSPDYSYIFGDFEVCRVQPDRPGHIGYACLTDGKNLVVQPLRDARPAFRLLSTWTPR